MFEDAEDNENVVNASDDSAETVELEVSKTLPVQVLQSSTRVKSQQSQKGIEDNEQDNSSRKRKNKKKKRTKKSGDKNTPNTVAFCLLTQCSVRHD